MSTNINSTLFQNFIRLQVGGDGVLSAKDAQKLGIEDQYQVAVDELDESNIDISDFTDDLLAEFATLYVEEQDKKTQAKDKEEEKEEQVAVKGKNEAGV